MDRFKFMSFDNKKITTFEDLVVWQNARELCSIVYSFTKKFPKDEIFALTSQLRRAVVSISSNIAEDFSRNTSANRVHFYAMARGSLTEAHSRMIISLDLAYISSTKYLNFKQKAATTHKLLTGLINATKRSNS